MDIFKYFSSFILDSDIQDCDKLYSIITLRLLQLDNTVNNLSSFHC